MLAIAVNALYTTVRKRGTTRQLAIAIVASVISALLLLPALLWYNLRFSILQAALSSLEIGLVLAYVATCGWLLPCSTTAAYCLLTGPRDSHTAGRLPRQRKRTTRAVAVSLNPPRRQAGVAAPFVYSSDRPWGWLVYRDGKFSGQELALKHAIVSIGREEDNELWLDDDTISRYHAELAWEKGQIYLTDADSLNGVALNGRRIRSSVLVKHGDELGIGGLHFWLKCAQQAGADELDDPLLPHLRRVAAHKQTASAASAGPQPGAHPPVKPTLALNQEREQAPYHLPTEQTAIHQPMPPTAALDRPEAHLPARSIGLCLIREGGMAGRNFVLNRPTLTVGRGPESDIALPEAAIASVHLQFSCQPEGDYVRDMTGHVSSQINGLPLRAPQVLKAGDVIALGDVQLEYTLLPEAQTATIPLLPPATEVPRHLPFPLQLPSKKQNI
jgi:pSer/pThr/pTyr-binding forkhead associated (FHA) protein